MLEKELFSNLILLYIEDEINTQKNIAQSLQPLFKNIICLQETLEAFELIKENKVDILLTDLALKHENSLDFIETIRSFNTTLPIIVLSAHMQTEFLLQANHLKLVDYLIKPTNFNTLIKALTKAQKELQNSSQLTVTFSNKLIYNLKEKQLYCNQERVALSALENRCLEFLLKNTQRLISKEELQKKLWGNKEGSESALKNVLTKLRKKIGKETLLNVSKIGYKLVL